MTWVAFAGKCVALTSPPGTAAACAALASLPIAARRSSESKLAKPSEPSPRPQRARNSRREFCKSPGRRRLLQRQSLMAGAPDRRMMPKAGSVAKASPARSRLGVGGRLRPAGTPVREVVRVRAADDDDRHRARQAPVLRCWRIGAVLGVLTGTGQLRKAVTGSTRIARRAGTNDAATATRRRSAA